MCNPRFFRTVAAATLLCTAGWSASAQAALLAEYRFDDTTSAAAFLKDSSSNGNDLTVDTGRTAPLPAPGGPFAGTVGGSYANLADADEMLRGAMSGFSAYTTHTVEMWIKPNVADADNSVRYFYGTSSAAIRLSVQHTKAGPQNVNFILRDSTGGYGTTTSIGAVDATGTDWMHIAYSYDANAASDNFKMYLNGTLKKSVTVALWASGGSSFTMSGGNKYFGGIDEMTVFDNVRSAVQIAYDAENSLVPEPASLSLLLLGGGLLMARRRRF